MPNSRESSIWRSLAVAFGDGLAFGAGVKVLQTASKASGAPTQTGSEAVTGRIAGIEQRLHSLEEAGAKPAAVDPDFLKGLVLAVEDRLREQRGETDKRLADLQAGLALELRSLAQNDTGLAARVEESVETIKAEMVRLNREFGESVANIVAQQVSEQVTARIAEIDRSLDARIALVLNAALSERLPAALGIEAANLESRLRGEMDEKGREVAQLKERISETDSNVLEVILAIGQMCRQVAGRISKPEDAEAPAAQATAAAEGATAEQRPAKLWRVPLVG